MAGFLVSASTGAMSSLLGKLGIMLSDEYKLLKNVRGDIKFLKDELEAMQAFLLKMADVEEPDQQEKLRANAVRELSYDIEDSIDKFMRLVEHEQASSNGFKELFNKSMKKITDINTRHKIAKDVKDIKSQVKEISERYARYTMNESSRPRNEKVDPRLCAVYKDASELVGINGPRDHLMKWLSDESAHELEFLSIVGSGGLGKTTLAKQVYDKLGASFECRAFVSISRSPDMTKVLSSISSQLRGKDYVDAGAGDPRLIIDQIREFLKDKRYFIIIDDIWDVPTWRILECAFVKNTRGSRVVATTRLRDVAQSCCSSHGDLVYNIQPLSDADSKWLFFKRIFGCEENCPPNLKEGSENILKKCSGLPLAIIAISSLLATGKTKEDWDRVRRSFGFGQGKNSDIDAMNYILSLSYFDLPLHLRSCLLYLTMFPEDYVIRRQRLVHRWISEGFIHQKDGQDLVELGETYFRVLVNRSLIQPVDIGYDGKASYCRVHDTVLDFLIYKSIEENFCTLLSNPSKPDRRVRRLCLTGNEDQGSVEQLDFSHARSLGAFGNSWEYLPFLVKSNALRVLDVFGCRGLQSHHFKDIGKLLQLRYLNISHTCISELPRQIGDLEYLETLNAFYTKLVELPESVTRLKRLARLFVGRETKLPDGIGNMKNLQELGDINPLKQSLKFVEELGKLANLRKLSIVWQSYRASYKKEKELVYSLCKLDTCKLHTLSIEFWLREKDAALMEDLFFPALSSIRKIDLFRGQLCWITKWLLSLVNLEQLNIWSGGRGPIIIASGGFQQLHRLYFNVTNELMFEAGAMPNLKELHLRILLREFKSARGGFDFGIQHLPSLDLVRVGIYCPEHVEGAESALKSMVHAHPNRPTLKMERIDARFITE